MNAEKEARNSDRITLFVEEHKEETRELLRKLTQIPAPSGQEEKKAAFVLDWLKRAGAEDAFIDAAGNVVYEYRAEETSEAAVFMAHMDVVFPDTEPFIIKEEGKIWYAPGICDDNADLANLLMGIKYLLTYRPRVTRNLLFAADVGEEGLGNLKGSRQIYETYGMRVREFIGFDGNLNRIVNHAVGSQRYCVRVRTEGGHSYNAFGNENAIYRLSGIIQKLYQAEVPVRAKTTYNVGTVTGGTSVNTIAQEASMLYEFRSEDESCLAEMEAYFREVIRQFQSEGPDVEAEELGIRPCGKGVDEEREHELTERHARIIRAASQMDPEVNAGSTDANIFLSHGIPSVVIGTGIGGRTHTREEWMDMESMIPGQKTALAAIDHYCEV